MSLKVAETLFEDLRAKKKGRELNKVEFVVGDFEDKPYSGPIYSPYWDEGRARLFRCEWSSENTSNCSIHGEGGSYGFDMYDDLDF